MVIVITGSTRGIGFALARAFLDRGASVMISGRSDKAVSEAVAKLGSAGGGDRLGGRACDVSVLAEVEALWSAALERFGRVDCWINNAGTCNAVKPFLELTQAEVDAVFDANWRGTVHGSRVALAGMLKQGHGKLFNMEGWGSKGEWSPGMTPYCTTKRALAYFTDALVKEMKGHPLQVGALSPGMVATDLLVSSYENGVPDNWKRMRWLFHFVIDPADVVCNWLADKVLANDKSGVHYRWMTPLRLLSRFFQPKYWRRNPVAGTALDTLGASRREQEPR